MSDASLNYFLARGTAAQRAAFTPSPPTPAAGPSPTYLWAETDTNDTYFWNGSSWTKVNSATALNAVTFAGSGGAAPGTTYNGSVARTIDYSSVGAAKTGAITASGLTFSATDKLAGRSTAGSGAVEEIACTAAGRALIDDADAAAQRTTLGLGGAATQSVNAIRQLTVSSSASTSYTLSSSDIWKHVRFTSGSAITLTVDTSHGFSAGDRVRVTAAGAGQITVTASGTTLNSRGAALKSAGQYAVFEIECVGTNEFDVIGDLTT